MNLFHSANNEIRRLAFLSKANATIESVGLTSKWIGMHIFLSSVKVFHFRTFSM